MPHPGPLPTGRRRNALRQYVFGLRSEGAESGRDAFAIALGVFLGCLPIYGFHLLLSIAVAKALGLNRLKVYLAANISNPFMAPILLLAELQTGALLRQDSLHALTLQEVRSVDLRLYALDIAIGALVIGVTLGTAALVVTRAAMKGAERDPYFSTIVRRASERYVGDSLTAWEFARAKLRLDPVYKQMLLAGMLPRTGTLIDIGCGQGLSMALLVEASDAAAEPRWTGHSPPPHFDRMIGIDTRPRVADLARSALAGRASIVCADARTLPFEKCSAVLLFDVLHMIPASAQRDLLCQLHEALEIGGVVLVREADAGAGWRFGMVRAGNVLKAIASGQWQQTFHFRSEPEWLACFASLGFRADLCPTVKPAGANLLFRLSKAAQIPPERL